MTGEQIATLLLAALACAGAVSFMTGLMSQPKIPHATKACDRCEGTGDRYGRAYGPTEPCPACGGTGVFPPGSGDTEGSPS